MFIKSIPCKPTKSSVSDASGACRRACSGCVHMPSTDSRAIEKGWKATILGSWNTYLSMPSQLLKNDAPLYEVIYPTKLLVQPVLVAAQDLKVMLELTRVWRIVRSRANQSFATCLHRSLSGSSSIRRAASWPTLGILWRCRMAASTAAPIGISASD